MGEKRNFKYFLSMGKKKHSMGKKSIIIIVNIMGKKRTNKKKESMGKKSIVIIVNSMGKKRFSMGKKRLIQI